MTANPPAPGGATVTRADVVRVLGVIAPVLLVVGSGLAGWVLAGAPGDGAAVVPAACPARLDSGGSPPRTGQSPGVAGQLVPVPLPQPRGPASVRVCQYTIDNGGYGLRRSVMVDPVWTAALAGQLNERPGRVVPGGRRPPECRPGGTVTVLVFRYTQGLPLPVEVVGGDCGLVATAARVETGRQDVVQRVTQLLTLSSGGW